MRLFSVIFIFVSLVSCKEEPNKSSVALGLINQRIEFSNYQNSINEDSIVTILNNKKDSVLTKKIIELKKSSERLDGYIEQVKSQFVFNINEPLDYSSMESSEIPNKYFFENNDLTENGELFLKEINLFRLTLDRNFKEDLPKIIIKSNNLFNTENIKDRDGKEYNWLYYYFEGFPLVASITNLTQIQSEIKRVKNEILLSLLAR